MQEYIITNDDMANIFEMLDDGWIMTGYDACQGYMRIYFAKGTALHHIDLDAN